ncbi:MAG: hypothetical protein J0L92_30090 [Deltaproteobacteria bacterium]|nr:hypothetical protein [Deltaproteobacteria bacterium]
MSALRIQRRLSDVSRTLTRAKAEAVKFRSTWNGDETGGSYVLRTPLGTLEGSYSVTGSDVVFVVEKKPRIVPDMLIERVLDEFLRG